MVYLPLTWCGTLGVNINLQTTYMLMEQLIGNKLLRPASADICSIGPVDPIGVVRSDAIDLIVRRILSHLYLQEGETASQAIGIERREINPPVTGILCGCGATR